MASKRNAEAISQGRFDVRLSADGSLPWPMERSTTRARVATMYVIEDPAAAFREMHRVLRPGGSAAVTFPVRENFMRFNPAAKAEGFHFHELPTWKQRSSTPGSWTPGRNGTTTCSSQRTASRGTSALS